MKAKNKNSLSVRTYAREGKEHSRRSCKKSACFARKSGCFRKYKRVIRQACSSVLSSRWVLAASQCGSGAPSVVGEPPRREDHFRYAEAMKSRKIDAPPLVFVGWRFGTTS